MIPESRRRILMVLLSMLLSVITVWAEDTTFGGGDGTAKNPYIITTSSH